MLKFRTLITGISTVLLGFIVFAVDAQAHEVPHSDLYRSQRNRGPGSTAEKLTTGYYIDPSKISDAMLLEVDHNILDIFERIGIWNIDVRHDRQSFGDAKVDFQAMLSHECFVPVRGEIKKCLRMFGPYYNLRESILDNTLRERLFMFNPYIRTNAFLLYDRLRDQILREEEKRMKAEASAETEAETSANLPPSIVTTGGNVQEVDLAWVSMFDLSLKDQLRMRSQFVWEVCKSKFETHDEAARCHLRNERFFLDPNVGLILEAEVAAHFIR